MCAVLFAFHFNSLVGTLGRLVQPLIGFVATLLALATLVGCDTQRIDLEPADDVEVDQWPAWSPDGSRIAYLRDAGWTEDTTDVTGLYILNLEPDTSRLVVEGFTMSPSWRPDGGRIVFSTGDIFTIRPDGSGLHRLVHRGRTFSPSWAPNGQRIAYDLTIPTDSSGLWLVNPDGSGKKYLGLGRFNRGRFPAWSPDHRILFEGYSDRSSENPQLWIADSSASDSSQFTDNDFINNRDPEWSPNGKWIAWAPVQQGDSEIWIMRGDGSAPRKLITGGDTPTWGPDSDRIVFAKPAPNSRLTALWMIRRDGSDLRQLTFPASSNQ